MKIKIYKKINYLINNKEIDISKTIEENNITDGSIIYYKIQEINNDDDEISVIIKSSDQAIKFPFRCQKGDKFKVLQQKLYEKYPNLNQKEHFYVCGGNIIYIEKTIEENKIKDNDQIIINEIVGNEEDEEISVNITSSDQSINISIKCKKNDKFKVLEDKLYEKYPNLKNEKHYYVGNGITIDIEKTIEENNIKDNDQLLYNINPFDGEV